MSAPQSAYLQIDSKFRGSNNVLMTILPAKSGYGSAGNLAGALALIKSTFYLDDVIGFKANYNGVEYHGFWGTCIVGSANYYMHKTERVVNVGANTTGADKRTFNDAGLNTLGFTGSPSCTNKQSGAHVFQALFKSAYYLHSSSLYFQVNRKPQAGGISDFNQVAQAGPLNQAVTATKTSTPDPITFDFNAGDYIEVESKIVNAEGTYTSAMTSFIVEPRQYSAKFNSSWASWACSEINGTTTVTIFASNWRMVNGSFLYGDLQMTAVVDPGYYAINGRWYKVEADLQLGSIITDQDECGTYRQGDPAWVAPYETKNWIHYEAPLSGEAQGCFVIGSNGTKSPRTTYRNLTNSKHYISTAAAIEGSTIGYTDDGFYYEGLGIITWIELSAGVQVNSGSC